MALLAMGGRLLGRFQADLNQGLASAMGICAVFRTMVWYLYSRVTAAERSGIRLKRLFIKGAGPPPPCLREIPKGAELRLA